MGATYIKYMSSGHQRALIVDITNAVTTGFQQMDGSTQRAEAAIGTLKSDVTQAADVVMSTLRDNTIQNSVLLERANELKEIVTKIESTVTEGPANSSEVTSKFQSLRSGFDEFAQRLDRHDDSLSRDITSVQSTL
jgi:soluble cytochrome b562